MSQLVIWNKFEKQTIRTYQVWRIISIKKKISRKYIINDKSRFGKHIRLVSLSFSLIKPTHFGLMQKLSLLHPWHFFNWQQKKVVLSVRLVIVSSDHCRIIDYFCVWNEIYRGKKHVAFDKLANRISRTITD